MHYTQIEERTLYPEDGLMLGNGDLSVSVYQTADRIIWRFGKGDVWDRRLDLSDNPRPAHIEEVARGIRDERWACPPYGGPVEALSGTDNPERMRELCQGSPPSYKRRPYPCPKPVGELSLHLPPDLQGMRITQRLCIEEATVTITCSWPVGVTVTTTCFVHPVRNVFVVHWRMEGWVEGIGFHSDLPPMRFSLYRWADPALEDFAARAYGESHHHMYSKPSIHPSVTPLPTPGLREQDGAWIIEQAFHPEPTFPNGFRYWMVAAASAAEVEPVAYNRKVAARIFLNPPLPARDGWVAVAVNTTRDAGGVDTALATMSALRDDAESVLAQWEVENREAASEFWKRSSVTLGDALLENLWYETLHARRCAYRQDAIPPGLFLPSSVPDYQHWHGDYHTNYNIQSPFWGDFAANQVEMGESYFVAMDFFRQIGRKIARDYYNCRGVFYQLAGFPIVAEDDPLGVVPMGRMAYMTGWATHMYWWRWRHTMDIDWLREVGYPALRESALFYADFLQEWHDGLFHLFPSNQFEDGFTGDPQHYTDRQENMQHVRYSLWVAIQAAEILSEDADLVALWRDRLTRCAGDDGGEPVNLDDPTQTYRMQCAPEFRADYAFTPRLLRGQGRSPEEDPWPAPGDDEYDWYFGHAPLFYMQYVRLGGYQADRGDFDRFRRLIARWRHGNGLIWAMTVGAYGHCGGWTESLGVCAPLQEMLLQSWDGSIRLFPAWPKHVEARFTTLRAEGAFLVSAAWKQGTVQSVQITSERGTPCRLHTPWPEIVITDAEGNIVPTTREEGDIVCFETQPGGDYEGSPTLKRIPITNQVA
jgi:hypothetical protein